MRFDENHRSHCPCAECARLRRMSSAEFRQWFSVKYDRPECPACGALEGSYTHRLKCEIPLEMVMNDG